MERITVGQVATYEGLEIELRGWLYNKRSSGKLHFLQVRDGTATIQCVVFKGDVPEEVFELCGEMTQESSLTIHGTVKRDQRSALGYEIGVSHVEVLQMAEPYPITPKEHGVAYLMDHLPAPRHPSSAQ